MAEKTDSDCIIVTAGDISTPTQDELLLLAHLARRGLKVDIVHWKAAASDGMKTTTVLALQPPVLSQAEAYFAWMESLEPRLLPFPWPRWMSFHLNALSLVEQIGLPILPTYVFNGVQIRGLTHLLASARWPSATATLNQRHAGTPLLITGEHIQRGEAQLNLLLQEGRMVLLQPRVETERKKHVFVEETWSHSFVQEPRIMDDGAKTQYPAYLEEGERIFATMAMERIRDALKHKFHFHDPLLLELVTGYYQAQLRILEVTIGALPLHLEVANLDLLIDALSRRLVSSASKEAKKKC